MLPYNACRQASFIYQFKCIALILVAKCSVHRHAGHSRMWLQTCKPFTSEGAIFGLLIRYVLLCQLRCTIVRSSICLLIQVCAAVPAGDAQPHAALLCAHEQFGGACANCVHPHCWCALWPLYAMHCTILLCYCFSELRQNARARRTHAQSRMEDGAEALPLRFILIYMS